MEKNILMGSLLDIYGELLPEKQRMLIDMACNADLSLSEISETQGITRQGVHDRIRRGELQLSAYEESLHLLEKKRARVKLLRDLQIMIDKSLAELEEDPAAARKHLEAAAKTAAGLLQKEE